MSDDVLQSAIGHLGSLTDRLDQMIHKAANLLAPATKCSREFIKQAYRDDYGHFLELTCLQFEYWEAEGFPPDIAELTVTMEVVYYFASAYFEREPYPLWSIWLVDKDGVTDVVETDVYLDTALILASHIAEIGGHTTEIGRINIHGNPAPFLRIEGKTDGPMGTPN